MNSFDVETIELDKKPELDLNEEKLNHFNHMINTKDNKEILEFINKYIGIDKYSYQISLLIYL